MVSGIDFLANFHEIFDFAILNLILAIPLIDIFKKAKIWGPPTAQYCLLWLNRCGDFCLKTGLSG
jgi:hypothetical protein